MLSDKKLFLFDIDGTVAIDETLIDGSRELFSHIDSIGGKSIFITNNSTKGVRDYMEKFRRMGVETDESNFITASYAAAIHLRAHYPGKKVFLLGTRSFAGELRAAGVDVTETLEPASPAPSSALTTSSPTARWSSSASFSSPARSTTWPPTPTSAAPWGSARCPTAARSAK